MTIKIAKKDRPHWQKKEGFMLNTSNNIILYNKLKLNERK